MEQGVNCLEIKNINKWYPSQNAKNNVHALKDISLIFTEGFYGITGHNGAGKSTLFSVLTGYLKADTGEIRWNDEVMNTRSKKYKKLLGYMPQQQTLYENMTCIQFMNYIAGLKGIKRGLIKEESERLLDVVNLYEKKNVRISELSGGMKQRLLFAQSLLGNPEILILDEPTAGVDPDERERIHSIISDNSAGKIVLMSTHILTDIEALAKTEVKMNLGEATIVAL